MGYRILWLEDDVDVIGIMTKALEQEGHTVEKVAKCIDAAARLDLERYDALILDIILERDGWTNHHGTYANHYFGLDVLNYTRRVSANKDVPVVVFSCLSSDVIQKELDKAGLKVSSILGKPTSQQLLKERVLEAIVQRHHA